MKFFQMYKVQRLEVGQNKGCKYHRQGYIHTPTHAYHNRLLHCVLLSEALLYEIVENIRKVILFDWHVAKLSFGFVNTKVVIHTHLENLKRKQKNRLQSNIIKNLNLNTKPKWIYTDIIVCWFSLTNLHSCKNWLKVVNPGYDEMHRLEN